MRNERDFYFAWKFTNPANSLYMAGREKAIKWIYLILRTPFKLERSNKGKVSEQPRLDLGKKLVWNPCVCIKLIQRRENHRVNIVVTFTVDNTRGSYDTLMKLSSSSGLGFCSGRRWKKFQGHDLSRRHGKLKFQTVKFNLFEHTFDENSFGLVKLLRQFSNRLSFDDSMIFAFNKSVETTKYLLRI